MKTIRALFVVLSIIVCFLGCSNDELTITDNQNWKTVKVAVVLPMQGEMGKHWKRTLNECASDLKEAFQGMPTGINLEYEWYDEDNVDIDGVAEQLAKRKDIVAVIGGYKTENAKSMAYKFCRSTVKKPFFTLTTTEELIHAFSSATCLWALTATDIAQSELLLMLAHSYGAKSVTLIADSKTTYGKTFTEWFAFQATELGLELHGVCDYAKSSIQEAAVQAATSRADFVICAPDNVDDIQVIEDTMLAYSDQGIIVPPRLYSDIAYNNEVINKLGNKAQSLTGITVGCDPASGYTVRYESTYGEVPLSREAQLFDAASMIAYASFIQDRDSLLLLNDAIKKLVDGQDEYIYSPSVEGMREFITKLAEGKNPDLKGVSGNLDFAKDIYTNVLYSTYNLYQIFNGKCIVLDYLSDDATTHASSALANWEWRSSKFPNTDFNIETLYNYPALDQKWALLVATSSGWEDYRHQADIYNIYQFLRKRGYDDDHIVLIAEDDIAYDPCNKLPGTVSVSVGGENVYKDMHIDYHPSDLNPEDIKSILCGERSERLPHVISADNDDNVFVFWSGHGQEKKLEWLGRRDGFSYEVAKSTLAALASKRCYRKMLWAVEACHSASVLTAVDGTPGMLAFASADAGETSKTDVFNYDMYMWMTNRFTRIFMENVTSDPNISLRELYYRLYTNTNGSHVCIFNWLFYGNLYKNTMEEFL